MRLFRQEVKKALDVYAPLGKGTFARSLPEQAPQGRTVLDGNRLQEINHRPV